MTISTSLKVAPLSMLFTATILAAVGNLKNNVIQQPKKSQLMITDTLNMVIVRTIHAPLEKVWRAWSEEALVKKWWGPRAFTAPVAKMNFKEGEKSLVCMRSNNGFEIYNTWSYTKIIPMQRIEFIQHFADKSGNKITPSAIGLPAGIPENVLHVITLHAVGTDKTEISITEFGYSDGQTVEMSKAGMNECLDKMEEYLKNLQP